MALYTTAGAADAALSQYAGLAVPSQTGSPSPMDDLITEASTWIEHYLGYAWAANQAATLRVTVSRDGQARVPGCDRTWCPMTALDAITVPGNAQYYGPALQLDQVEWDADGALQFAWPVIYQYSQWVNPVPGNRLVGSLKLYPDEVEVSIKRGPAGAVPPIFQVVCHQVMAVLLMTRDDTDMHVASKVSVKDLGTATEYRRNAVGDKLRALARYKAVALPVA